MISQLLNFLSAKLGIDANYLYRGFFWIGISTLLIFGINFIKSVIFANFLRPETYGTYRYVLTLIEIASAFSLTGVAYVISRSVAQGFEGAYRRGMLEYIKHSWLSVLITSCIAGYYFYQESYTLGWAIGIGGLLAPLLNTFRTYTALLEGKRRVKLLSHFQALSNTIPALFTIGIAILYSDSVLILVLSYFLSYTIFNAILSSLSTLIIKPNNEIDPESKKFTFHLSLMGTLSVMVDQIDKILLFQMIGPAQLAMYTFASSLPDQFNVLGKGLKTLIYPKLSIQTLSSIQKHIIKRAWYIFLVSLVIFVSYVIAAPYLFQTFFPKYIDAVLLSQVYALSVFLLIAIPYKYALFAHSCTHELYISKITMIVTRILTLAMLLPFFGLWGAVISHLITRFIEMAALIVLLHIKK